MNIDLIEKKFYPDKVNNKFALETLTSTNIIFQNEEVFGFIGVDFLDMTKVSSELKLQFPFSLDRNIAKSSIENMLNFIKSKDVYQVICYNPKQYQITYLTEFGFIQDSQNYKKYNLELFKIK